MVFIFDSENEGLSLKFRADQGVTAPLIPLVGDAKTVTSS